jgi:TnpA family transposase
VGNDSLFILDTLLNLDGGVEPEIIALITPRTPTRCSGCSRSSATASPHGSETLPDQRFWRTERPDGQTSHYGPLEPIACNRINLAEIENQWPDMLRVAGSLVTNQVRACDLLRIFGRVRHPTPLGQAFAEYRRIDKTMHLLSLVDPVDDTYRRRMNRQLTVQESRHRLARVICHGRRGQIHRAYREGQED